MKAINSLSGLIMLRSHSDFALDFKVMKVTVELIQGFVLENMCVQYKSNHNSLSGLILLTTTVTLP
jgi:hypothetical protein